MSDVYLFKTLEYYFYNYTPLLVRKIATDTKQTSTEIKKTNRTKRPMWRGNDSISVRILLVLSTLTILGKFSKNLKGYSFDSETNNLFVLIFIIT